MAWFWYFKLVWLLVPLIHTPKAIFASKSIQLPALGRPFVLGDLYDLKADNIIIGPKLWNSDRLANYTERIQRTTKFEVTASEDIQELKNYFDLKARLSLSFLGGLVEVSGSAGYLDDRVQKSNIARVALIFSTRTFSRELKPELFTKVDFEDVLEKVSSATHVVVGMQYGASAVFVFDKTLSSHEVKRDVTGSMQASINSLPGIKIKGGAEVEISEEDKKKVEKFSCKFHGDFVLKEHPGTYEEAIKVYKELPTYLGDNYENSVPMTVWLYPLDALPIAKESEIVHEIRNSLVHEVTVRFEELNEMEVFSNDVLDSVVAQFHERIQQKVEVFKSNVHLFTLLLKQRLAKLLPEIRASGKESSLAQVLADKESSPFAKVHLDEWMANVKHEVIVLDATHRLPNYCRPDGHCDALLLNGKKYTFALTLRLDGAADPFLEEMEGYLEESKYATDCKSVIGTEFKWWNNHSLIADLQRKGSSFAGFHAMEKEKTESDILKSDIQFLVRETILSEGSSPRITIEKFKYASLVDDDYEIPSAAGAPKDQTASFNEITITWDEPQEGAKNVHHYKIQTYILENSDDADDKNHTKSSLKKLKPIQTKGKVETMRVQGLKPERSYMFIVDTFCELGKTAVSKQSEFIQTMPCPKGTYYSKEKCFPCDPGYFSETEAALSCDKCPMGTRSGRGSYECRMCPKGSYAKENQCLPCDPGKFAAQPGSTSCKECPVGFFAEPYGSDKCQRCPNGTVTLQTGAKSESECGGDLNMKIEKILNNFQSRVNENIDAKNLVQDATFQRNLNNVESRVNETFYRLHGILVQKHNFSDSTSNDMFENGKWYEYKKGFGDPTGETFWIGLDQLHSLTNDGRYNVIYEVVWDKNYGGSSDPLAGTSASVEFQGFFVASEAEGFKLTIGELVRKNNFRESRGNVNYRGRYNNGYKFATKDQENSGYGCPTSWKGGWWFHGCINYCLNCNEHVMYDNNYRIPATLSIWLRKVD